jgi:tRNA/rRNA methyltransferase/tRNA (cytidine32/uridine32-2'-O)-methyltransferase
VLTNIRIVLVDTTHPGNIGAVARAMKNMGLSQLALVRPKAFPDAEATARASGADDVLAQVQVHSRLEDAIADCGLVVGTSARQRHMHWEQLEPRECAQALVSAAKTQPVAVLFGSERFGLTNAELLHCRWLVTIPTHEAYSSLNVAMAVQVLAYEIWLAARDGVPPQPERDAPLATAYEMEHFYAHLEEVLAEIEFRDRTPSGQLMKRLKLLFNRAGLDQNEVNILRGIMTAVQAKRRRAGNRS